MDSAHTRCLRWFVEGVQMSARDGGAYPRTRVSRIARCTIEDATDRHTFRTAANPMSASRSRKRLLGLTVKRIRASRRCSGKLLNSEWKPLRRRRVPSLGQRQRSRSTCARAG
jgi:hypothetical protein